MVLSHEPLINEVSPGTRVNTETGAVCFQNTWWHFPSSCRTVTRLIEPFSKPDNAQRPSDWISILYTGDNFVSGAGVASLFSLGSVFNFSSSKMNVRKCSVKHDLQKETKSLMGTLYFTWLLFILPPWCKVPSFSDRVYKLMPLCLRQHGFTIHWCKKIPFTNVSILWTSQKPSKASCCCYWVDRIRMDSSTLGWWNSLNDIYRFVFA